MKNNKTINPNENSHRIISSRSLTDEDDIARYTYPKQQYLGTHPNKTSPSALESVPQAGFRPLGPALFGKTITGPKLGQPLLDQFGWFLAHWKEESRGCQAMALIKFDNLWPIWHSLSPSIYGLKQIIHHYETRPWAHNSQPQNKLLCLNPIWHGIGHMFHGLWSIWYSLRWTIRGLRPDFPVFGPFDSASGPSDTAVGEIAVNRAKS